MLMDETLGSFRHSGLMPGHMLTLMLGSLIIMYSQPSRFNYNDLQIIYLQRTNNTKYADDLHLSCY